MTYYIDPARKNYTAIKAAVDRHAPQYPLYVALLGGNAAIAMTILLVVNLAFWISVATAVGEALKVYAAQVRASTAARNKTEEMLTKMTMELVIGRFA